jgi:adenylate kinase family enzyme
MTFDKLYSQLILEMPQQIDTPLKMDTPAEFIRSSWKQIENIQLDNVEYEMFQIGNGKDFDVALISGDTVALEASYEIFGKGVKPSYVQQQPNLKGLARLFYVEYYMNKFDFILSDTTMTKSGFLFWTRLFEQYKTQFIFSVYHKKKDKLIKIKNRQQMEEVFGRAKKFHYYQFVMQKY